MVKENMRNNLIATIIIILIIAVIAYQDAKIVLGDDDQVIITQFGKVVEPAYKVPGEYFKYPFIQKTHYFSKFFYATDSWQEVPTEDKKFVLLKTRSFWEISDPIKYYQNLNSYDLAKDFVSKHIGAAERDVITAHELADLTVKDVIKALNDVRCKRKVEYKIAEISKPNLMKAGIKLSNIQCVLTYPLKDKMP